MSSIVNKYDVVFFQRKVDNSAYEQVNISGSAAVFFLDENGILTADNIYTWLQKYTSIKAATGRSTLSLPGQSIYSTNAVKTGNAQSLTKYSAIPGQKICYEIVQTTTPTIDTINGIGFGKTSSDPINGTVDILGDLVVTGSIRVTGGMDITVTSSSYSVSSSHSQTASYALNGGQGAPSETSSYSFYAETASYIENGTTESSSYSFSAVSASYAKTASYISLAHNSTTGLQGGQSSQYYHLTSAEYSTTSQGTGVFLRQTGSRISASKQTGSAFLDATIPGLPIPGMYSTYAIVTGNNLKTAINDLDLSIHHQHFTGFFDWSGSGTQYWSTSSLGVFTLNYGAEYKLQGRSKILNQSQSVQLTPNATNLIYAGDDGVLRSTPVSNTNDEFWIINSPFFEILWDSRSIFVVRENHPYDFPVAISRYLHENAGIVLVGTGAVMAKSGSGTGTVIADRQINLLGNDQLSDHGLEVPIISTGITSAVNWNIFYQSSSRWYFSGSNNQLHNIYTPTVTGMPTLAANNEYCVYSLYVSKDSVNDSTPSFIAVTDNSKYASVAQANNAITNGSNLRASNELTDLEICQLGFAIIGRNSGNSFIDSIIVQKSTFNTRYTSGGISGNHSTLLNLSTDDHLQYTLLSGRTNGQTLYGGLGQGQPLVLRGSLISTSSIFLNDTGGYVAVGNGILNGNTNPQAQLHISTSLVPLLKVDGQNIYNLLYVHGNGYIGFGTTGSNNYLITTSGSIAPLFTSTFDLGGELNYWRNLYVNTISSSYITGRLYGTASFADESFHSLTSDNADFAWNATNANFAITSSYSYTSSLSFTSSVSTTSSFSNTSSFARTASFSTTSSFSNSSSLSKSSSFSNSSSFSVSSSFAKTASFSTTSSFAFTASFVVSCSFSKSSSFSETASYSLMAKTASYSFNAETSSYSYTASYVSGGLHVDTSSYSYFAEVAKTASYYSGIIDTSSYAKTSSFSETSSYSYTSSFSETSSYSLSSSVSLSSSFSRTASYVSDADTVDGYHAKFFFTASNITNGVLPINRLTGSYNITSSWALNCKTASYIGSGIDGYFPYWNNNSLTTSSILYYSNGKLGINTTQLTSSFTIKNEHPDIELKSITYSPSWLLRNRSGSFDIFDIASQVPRLHVSETGEVIIGSTYSNVTGNNSKLFIYGGSGGANVDIMGNPAEIDQATLELEGSDYSTNFDSVRFQYYGPQMSFGTTLGYPNKCLGQLCFSQNSHSLIYTTNNTPLRFGVDLLEQMTLTTSSLGIGITNPNPNYKLQVSGTIAPVGNGIHSLGSPTNKFSDLYTVQTTVGAFFESGLRTENIGKCPTGTIVIWKNGKLEPCSKNDDKMVMGVLKEGKDEPIILGAEPVLITGKIKEGDYIVTSKKLGHGKSVGKRDLYKNKLFGKIIAQSLEDGEGKSFTVKAMIRKV